MQNKHQNPDYLVWLAFFYSIAHGGILLILNAIYWDDWVLSQVDPSIISDTFKQAGSMFNITAHLHVGLLYMGPWFYKVLTLVLMFGAGLALNAIIKRHTVINDNTRFLIVLLFLILPFNWARVALIDFPYTLCYFLFFLAWVLIDRHRIVALALFALSFNTLSLLVFYALPFLDLYIRSGKKISIPSFVSFCKKKIDFIILPFLFFFIKVYFFPPGEMYEGYNQQYAIKNLVISPVIQLYDLLKLDVNFILSLIFTIISYLLLKKILMAKEEVRVNCKVLALLGVLAFVAGVFPYWILGHAPTFEEWTSRHQLLLPLGFALFFVAIVHYLKQGKRILLSLIIGVSLALNVNTYKDFYIDAKKQHLLMDLMGDEPLIENASIVIFDDQTMQLNAIKREYRFYEWNGLLASVYNNEKRFGVDIASYSKLLNGEYKKHFFTAHYRAGDFPISAQKHTVVNVTIREIPAPGFKEKVIAQFVPNIQLEVAPLPEIALTFE